MRKLFGLLALLALVVVPGAAFAAAAPAPLLPAELSLALMQQEPMTSQAFTLETVFQQADHQQSLLDTTQWVCSRSCTLCGNGPSGFCPQGSGQCVPSCP
ncbi:MAG TPA: hypothetical protein VLB76_28945 [Thermoanaerobaculia bacterium]|jgi:hypothetical protein|nr:hypothetical protein [Thermoanaerobaculia bacterium]